MISGGFRNWRGSEFYPKQGWTLSYSKDLSYFSVRLAIRHLSVWFLVGWSWRWRSSL
jgi:hypothetical protein